jgi:5-formyltetrahydrofolate cyclo-ligase
VAPQPLSQPTPPPADDLAKAKDVLRRDALARRDGLDREARHAASLQIRDAALGLDILREPSPVGAYWPIRSEVDVRPLLEALIARGQDAALPQILHPHLSFRLWKPGDPLVHGGFKVSEPGPDAPECTPRALLVPLAAFDRHGGRVGYGKGHFDRAIAALRARGPLVAVGLAFAAQEVERVPQEDHDQRLDAVVTESGVHRFGD